MGDDLSELRVAIDEVDDEILGLLNRRAGIVRRVGELKREGRGHFHVPGRERAVLERLTAAAAGPFPPEAVRPVFREIMSACLALEMPLRVAYVGPEASLAHLAGRTRFGLQARYVPAASIAEVFHETARGSAEYGVVPVEEASEGLVTHALDLFLDSDALIVGEIVVDTAHALLTRSGTMAGVERIFAHPSASARCAAALVEAAPHAAVAPAASAAAAAAFARDDERVAAVAPAAVAELFDLAVVKPRLEDGPAEPARFLVLGHTPSEPTGADATSLIVGLDDQPGRLAAVLGALARAGVNLRRISSRPTDRRGLRDLFFIDVDGHSAVPPCREGLAELAAGVPLLKVLGSYPQAAPGRR